MEERGDPDLDHVRDALRDHDERERLPEEAEQEPSEDEPEDDGE